jgi:hypothetical protein
MTTTLAAPSIVLGAWLRIAPVSALSFVVVEIVKWLRRSKPILMNATKRE